MSSGLGEAVSRRIREEPVLTVGLVRAAVTMLVGFGLGWTGEQVALMVAFVEAVTAWLARRQVNADGQTSSAGGPGGPATGWNRGGGRAGLTVVDGSLTRLRLPGLRKSLRVLWLADDKRAPLRSLRPPGLRQPLPSNP